MIGTRSQNPGAALADFLTNKETIDEAVAACMQANGFEWRPSPVPGKLRAYDETFGTLDWALRYGLGVSTLAFPSADLPEDLIGHPGSAGGDADPNETYLAELDAAQRQEFDRALHGESLALPDGGCLDDAASEDGVGRTAEFLAEFGDELQVAQQAAGSAPDVVVLDREIASCMADSSWATSSVDEFQDETVARLASIQRGYDPSVGLSAEATATLRALQATELEFARAWHECRRRTEADRRLEDAQRDAIRAFIDANQDGLRRFLSEGG